jgi:hypothetical protein
MDRHPPQAEGVAAAAPLEDRWIAAITAGRLGVDVGGEGLGEQFAIQVQVHHLASVRVLNGTGSQRRRHKTVGEGLGLQELLDALNLRRSSIQR